MRTLQARMAKTSKDKPNYKVHFQLSLRRACFILILDNFMVFFFQTNAEKLLEKRIKTASKTTVRSAFKTLRLFVCHF